MSFKSSDLADSIFQNASDIMKAEYAPPALNKTASAKEFDSPFVKVALALNTCAEKLDELEHPSAAKVYSVLASLGE